MRCPNCNKFVAYDDSNDPEHQLEVSVEDDIATVSGSVRIVLCCAECSTELKEYNFDVDASVTLEGAEDHECDYGVMVDCAALTSRSDCGVNKKTGKLNKYNPRYATTFYGYSIEGLVACDCGKIGSDFSITDDVRASSMDEMV